MQVVFLLKIFFSLLFLSSYCLANDSNEIYFHVYRNNSKIGFHKLKIETNQDLKNIFLNTLNSYKKGSRSRKQCGTTLNVFAKFINYELPEDWKLLSRGYGLKKASYRILPNDDLIEELWNEIPNQSWKFVFALMATYGLRNHEV